MFSKHSVGAALLSTASGEGEGHLSHDVLVRDEPVLHSPQISICSQAAAQMRDAHVAFGGNRTPMLLQGCGPRSGPW